jgi:hypothetical protein
LVIVATGLPLKPPPPPPPIEVIVENTEFAPLKPSVPLAELPDS